MPPRKYRPTFFFHLLRAKVFFSLLTILTLLVQHSQSRKFFPPWIRYTSSACFVCRQSSSRWCLLFHPSLRSGSTLLLTSRVHLSPPVVVYGSNRPYQSSLYRLNFNPPSTITLLYHAVASSLPSRYGRERFRSSSVQRSSPTCLPRRAILVLFLYWLAGYPSPVLADRISTFQYLNSSLALSATSCPRTTSRYLRFAYQSLPVTSSRLCQPKKVLRPFLEECVRYSSQITIRLNDFRPHWDICA